MSDDGTGSDIYIPLVLISKKDGEILKEYYRSNKNRPELLRQLLLDVEFQMEHSSNTAKIDIFMNSESSEIYDLISSMNNYYDICKN